MKKQSIYKRDEFKSPSEYNKRLKKLAKQFAKQNDIKVRRSA